MFWRFKDSINSVVLIVLTYSGENIVTGSNFFVYVTKAVTPAATPKIRLKSQNFKPGFLKVE